MAPCLKNCCTMSHPQSAPWLTHSTVDPSGHWGTGFWKEKILGAIDPRCDYESLTRRSTLTCQDSGTSSRCPSCKDRPSPDIADSLESRLSSYLSCLSSPSWWALAPSSTSSGPMSWWSSGAIISAERLAPLWLSACKLSFGSSSSPGFSTDSAGISAISAGKFNICLCMQGSSGKLKSSGDKKSENLHIYVGKVPWDAFGELHRLFGAMTATLGIIYQACWLGVLVLLLISNKWLQPHLQHWDAQLQTGPGALNSTDSEVFWPDCQATCVYSFQHPKRDLKHCTKYLKHKAHRSPGLLRSSVRFEASAQIQAFFSETARTRLHYTARDHISPGTWISGVTICRSTSRVRCPAQAQSRSCTIDNLY